MIFIDALSKRDVHFSKYFAREDFMSIKMLEDDYYKSYLEIDFRLKDLISDMDNRMRVEDCFNILIMENYDDESVWLKPNMYFIILRKSVSKHCPVKWTMETEYLLGMNFMSAPSAEDIVKELEDCNYIKGEDYVLGLYDMFANNITENNWIETAEPNGQGGGLYARYVES